MTVKMKTVGILLLGALLAGCAAEQAGTDASADSKGFSNCFKDKVRQQLTWCLAGDPAGEDFYRASGRHQVIYGRYNARPGMVKEGLSYCLFEQEERSHVNACTPEEVMALATSMLPPEENDSCEATTDPKTSLSGC